MVELALARLGLGRHSNPAIGGFQVLTETLMTLCVEQDVPVRDSLVPFEELPTQLVFVPAQGVRLRRSTSRVLLYVTASVLYVTASVVLCQSIVQVSSYQVVLNLLLPRYLENWVPYERRILVTI